MAKRGNKYYIKKEVTNNYTENKENKSIQILGVVSAILTVISFFGISGVALINISNIENMVKFIGKWYLLIPIITMGIGILNYYLVISFMEINRKFIKAGHKSGGIETDFKLHPVMKYCAIAFLLGLWLIEIDFIKLMILSVTKLIYPIEIYLICSYVSVAIVFILTIVFSYVYLFKSITWGSCIMTYRKTVLSLYITWGIVSLILIILNMIFR